MRKSWVIVTSVLLLLFLTSCANPPALRQTPKVAQPDSGKTTVVGRVTSETDGQPLANTTVRLAEVIREGSGAYVLDEGQSPSGVTDEQGNFAIPNIDVHEYVIVIGDVAGTYDIIADDSGKPRVWKTQPDNILDVGDIEVNFSEEAQSN